LKEALRAKELAITELSRKSVQDAADAVKAKSVASENKAKKLREGTLPMSSSTSGSGISSSSKTVGGTSKTAGSRGRSRPPLAGSQSQSATPSPRSGL
jgi:hypothetical protein